MPNTNECETCGGEGVLIGDKADARGERTDDAQPCPDCIRDQGTSGVQHLADFEYYEPELADSADEHEYDDRDAFLDAHGEP